MATYLDFIKQLTELSYDPFFVVDRERRITHFNHPFDLMLGLSAAKRRQVVGTAFDELMALDQTGESCLRDCLERDSNVRVQGANATTPDGRHIVLDMSALPLRDDGGQLVAVMVLHRDVTDEQRLKERYNRVKKEHLAERESLLRIIADRDIELKKRKRST